MRLKGVFLDLFLAKAENEQKKRIVVLGSGWGAVNFLKHLKPGKYDVSVVSPSNYFLFTPFLPSVTVGTVEGRSTVEPIRKIIKKYHKEEVDFFEAECINVDVEGKKIFCKDTSGEMSIFRDLAICIYRFNHQLSLIRRRTEACIRETVAI